MVAYYGQVLTHWWFWVSLPFLLVLFEILDRGLGAYTRRYWGRRGQEPPPRRFSFRLGADNFAIYAIGAIIFAFIALLDGDWTTAGIVAAIGAVFAVLTVWRARQNVL